MKYLGISTLMCAFLTSQAVALSCLPYNIAGDFNRKQSSKDIYVMGLGAVTTKKRIPRYIEGKKRSVSMQFTGVFLGTIGSTVEQKSDVTVDIICASVWCGSIPNPDDEIVAFLKNTPSGYRLTSDPCGGDYKIAPTTHEIDLLKKCLKNGKCSNAQIKSLD